MQPCSRRQGRDLYICSTTACWSGQRFTCARVGSRLFKSAYYSVTKPAIGLHALPGSLFCRHEQRVNALTLWGLHGHVKSSHAVFFRTILGRMANFDEMMLPCSFLCSDASSY